MPSPGKTPVFMMRAFGVLAVLLISGMTISSGSKIESSKVLFFSKFESEGYAYPFLNPSLPWDQRVDDLVARLTLEEIAHQTLALYPKPTPAIPRLGIKPYVWITECLRGQLETNTTAFPQSLGLAATFSGDTIYFMAQALSYEIRAQWNAARKAGLPYTTFKGLSCFSPDINIMRHPLWGRNQETYGEDPYLSGVLAQNFVRGLQGDNIRYVAASAGCKAFDAYAGPENIPVSRFSFDAKVSTRDWRMTFLPQFKMCVEAGTYSLMCSYNSINGVPACVNQELLTNITRKEWGFKGYIVSDSHAIINVIKTHKYLSNKVDTSAAAINAGCNLELSDDVYLSQLQALKEGKLTEKEIRDNVKPLFYTRMRIGEFDPENMNPYNKIGPEVIQSAPHRELAIQAAMKSFVLLKNAKNTLPLGKKFKQANIAVIGPFANATDQLFGDYGSNVVEKYTKTVFQGLSQISPKTRLASGCTEPSCMDYMRSKIQGVVEEADLNVICLGTGQLEKEAHDRTSLALPGKQKHLLMDVVAIAAGKPVILLLFTAGPLDITYAKLSPGVHAILECFYPAQATGEALYRVLMNNEPSAVPAGRLPATWPAYLSQVPPITDYSMAGHTYRFYQGDPLYPFGYGLSYTTFTYSSLSILPNKISVGHDVNVKVTVRNTGQYDADEVVQVYMSWSNTSVPLPKLQLVAFQRKTIISGQSQDFSFVIRAEQMAVWTNDKIGWGTLTGNMSVYVGGQQPNQKTSVPSNVLTSKFIIV